MPLIKRKTQQESQIEKAVVLLNTVREGILAEKAIRKQGYIVKKVAPPVEYRKGCEIAVEIDFNNKEEIEKILKEYGLESQGIIKI